MKRATIALVLLLSSQSAFAELPSASDAVVKQALASGKPAVIVRHYHVVGSCRFLIVSCFKGIPADSLLAVR